MELSAEQQNVIECINQNQSVIIDAVAGSGKTTTVIGIAKALKTKYILQITYNAHLKLEVKEKVHKENIENLEVHTYHSLSLKYYKCFKDEQIKNVLEYNTKPKKTIPNFSVIVIDEIQDMRQMYFNLILKFIKDLGHKVTIIVSGDKYQGIYEFSDADTRFLTLADQIYPNNFVNFVKQEFKTSYRVTKQVAMFLNKHIIGYDRIISANTNTEADSVKYICCNKNSDESVRFIISIVISKLKLGYKPSDFFILSYSVKQNDFLKRIENILTQMKIYVYYENSDEEKTPDSKLIDNKLVFTTIHCSKGRERKFVIFDGFDSSFDHFCKKSKKNPKLCPAELYTALTRSSQELFLIHDNKKDYIGCLTDIDYLTKSDYLKFIKLDELVLNKTKEPTIIKNIFSVSDLVNHLGSTLIELQKDIDNLFTQIVEPGKILTIKDTIYDPLRDITENVTDINGLVIPMIYESLQNDKEDCYILKIVKSKIDNIITEPDILNQILNMKFTSNTKMEDYISIGIYYSCICTKLLHKHNQITFRNWLNIDDVKECHKHLSKYLSSKPQWEQSLSTKPAKSSKQSNSVFNYVHPKLGCIDIYNRIDAIDENNVWELKCVNSLTIEHKLQLIIYYFIYANTNPTEVTKKDFKLLNMKSGEVLLLDKNDIVINNIINKILETKILVKDKISDDEFIELCKSSKYTNLVNNLKEFNNVEVPKQQKLDRLDVAKLKAHAKKLKIKGFSSMKKEELINEIIMCEEKTGKYKITYGMF